MNGSQFTLTQCGECSTIIQGCDSTTVLYNGKDPVNSRGSSWKKHYHANCVMATNGKITVKLYHDDVYIFSLIIFLCLLFKWYIVVWNLLIPQGSVYVFLPENALNYVPCIQRTRIFGFEFHQPLCYSLLHGGRQKGPRKLSCSIVWCGLSLFAPPLSGVWFLMLPMELHYTPL